MPDIRVNIGPFKPNLTGCYSLDRKFYVKKNYIYLCDSDKSLGWEAEVSWSEQGNVIINFKHNLRNYLAFPWLLFPDLIMEMYVLQPIIEWKLIQKGYFLLHAAAVCRNDEAVIISGRGGCRKTDLTMDFLRRGYEFISDDYVILKGLRVLSLPLSLGLFTFSYQKAGRESLSFLDQIRLYAFLKNKSNKTFPVRDGADIKKAFIIFSTLKDSVEKRRIGPDKAVEYLFTNQEKERMAYVSYKYIIGSFMEAYEYVFPEFSFFSSLGKVKEEISKQFIQNDIVSFAVEIPKDCDNISLSVY